jgi:hypothetical protein
VVRDLGWGDGGRNTLSRGILMFIEERNTGLWFQDSRVPI